MKALAALLAVALSGCSTMVYTHGVPNFHVVAAPPLRAIYRGGEPTAEGWAYLRDTLHVCATVQLDYDEERPSGVVPPDEIAIVPASMPPADGDNLFRGPSQAALIDAVVKIDAEPQVAWCAVYVHCKHGQDRTGLVVAAYRHRVQHWSKRDAMAEARRYGFHPELLGLLHAWDELP